ncbi:MAG: TIR domain-containing protein [Chitinophagaceae bacterium]
MDGINVFISYSHHDKQFLDELMKHLVILSRQGLINIWEEGMIEAGRNWNQEIKNKISEADLVIMLISADFLASEYIYGEEVQEAFKKHEEGRARILPVIIRACNWQDTPFAKFQVVPRSARPVSSWESKDEAYLDIARTVRIISEQFISERQTIELPTVTEVAFKRYPLEEVFVSSGPPTLTFVEPRDFKYIKLALLQPGRGIVIEGPSGIGKTTVALRVLEQTGSKYELLSARLEDHVDKIRNFKNWPDGILVIDDFHRLEFGLKEKVANYLKYLADYGIKDKKIILIGIPNTGDTLIRISFDLANRITIFKLGSVDDETLNSLILKGEEALNIEFKQKSSIVREAYGSLYIAQLLCAYIAVHNEILQSQERKVIIETGILDVIDRIIKDLSPKFDDTVRYFASIGGKKSRIAIHLLSELAITEEGVLNLNHLKVKKPEFKEEIEKLLKTNLIDQFYIDYPQCARHLLFDKVIPGLVIDDPQFKFYLNNVAIEKLFLATGKSGISVRSKIFISYSRNDEEWLKKLLVHLKHLERKGLVDLWVDTRINAGENWRKEIQNALDKTKIAILILTPDFLASDFIINNELPPILKAAEQDNVKIYQLYVRPSSVKSFEELAQFQMVNDPKKPLASLSQVKQDEIFVRLAEMIENELDEE